MAEIDTSPAAIERLAARLDRTVISIEVDGVSVSPAAVVRALAAARENAEEVARFRHACMEAMRADLVAAAARNAQLVALKADARLWRDKEIARLRDDLQRLRMGRPSRVEEAMADLDRSIADLQAAIDQEPTG